MSATQYCAYAFVTVVGVALLEGVDVGLVEIVREGVGAGAVVEPQPLSSKADAKIEAVKTAEFLDFFIPQIYLVSVQVEKVATM